MTKEVLEWLKLCTSDERVEFFTELFEQYCRHCGSEHPAEYNMFGRKFKIYCQCWNDE